MVAKLSKNPEPRNPARSFDPFIKHLTLLKKISELIWEKPDLYSGEIIMNSRVMKGLWMFVSYCETYNEDCYRLKRCHLNLLLIIETF